MLKTIFRILALVLALAAFTVALVAAIRDVMGSAMTPLGFDWFSLWPGTLNLAQALTQRYVHPVLWDPVIQSVLLAPSWFVFACLGLIFALLARLCGRR